MSIHSGPGFPFRKSTICVVFSFLAYVLTLPCLAARITLSSLKDLEQHGFIYTDQSTTRLGEKLLWKIRIMRANPVQFDFLNGNEFYLEPHSEAANHLHVIPPSAPAYPEEGSTPSNSPTGAETETDQHSPIDDNSKNVANEPGNSPDPTADQQVPATLAQQKTSTTPTPLKTTGNSPPAARGCGQKQSGKGRGLKTPEKKREKRTKHPDTITAPPSMATTGTVYAALFEAPVRRCRETAGKGIGGFKKLWRRFSPRKIAANAIRSLFSSGKKIVRKPGRSRIPRQTAAPFFTVTKGVVALIVTTGVAALSVGWKWVQPDKEAAIATGKKKAPAPLPSQTKDDINCPELLPPAVRQACTQAVKSDHPVAAELIALFGFGQPDRNTYPAAGVYESNNDNRIISSPEKLSDSCTGLEYGAVGFVDRHRASGNTPAFQIDDQDYIKTLLNSSILLTGYISDSDLLDRISPELLDYALAWCGFPINRPSKRFHKQCIRWVSEQYLKEGEDWHKKGLHHYFHRMQTTVVTMKHGTSYLSLSPIFPVSSACTLEQTYYQPRLLEPAPETGLYYNRPIENNSGQIPATPPDWANNQSLFVYQGSNAWQPVHQNASNSTRFGAGQLYGLSTNSSQVPDLFFAFHNGQIIQSVTQVKDNTRSEQLRYHFVRQPHRSIQPQSLAAKSHVPDPTFRIRASMAAITFLTSRIMGSLASGQYSSLVKALNLFVSFYAIGEALYPPPYSTNNINDASSQLHRLNGLSGLKEHFLQTQSYPLLNLLAALSMDSDIPLGVIEFKSTSPDFRQGYLYTPLSIMSLERQVELFSSALDVCKKQFTDCDHSNRDHLEFVRFKLAICDGLRPEHCLQAWSGHKSRLAWDTLINALDWPEYKVTLLPDSVPPDRYISYPVLRKEESVWRVRIFAKSSGTRTELSPYTHVSVPGQYTCSGENSKHDKSHCYIKNNQTLVSNSPSGLVILKAKNHENGTPHSVYFDNGRPVTPYWNREATWFQNIKPGKATTEVCHEIASENLRLVCLEARSNDERLEILRLDQRTRPAGYLPVFSFSRIRTGNVTGFKQTGLTTFAELPIERIRQHFALLNEFPSLKGDPNTEAAILRQTGTIHFQGEDPSPYYRKMYAAINSNAKILTSPAARCFRRYTREGAILPEVDPYLFLAPVWISNLNHLSVEFEPVFGNLPPHKTSAPSKLEVMAKEVSDEALYSHSYFSLKKGKTLIRRHSLNYNQITFILYNDGVVYMVEQELTGDHYLAIMTGGNVVQSACESDWAEGY